MDDIHESVKKLKEEVKEQLAPAKAEIKKVGAQIRESLGLEPKRESHLSPFVLAGESGATYRCEVVPGTRNPWHVRVVRLSPLRGADIHLYQFATMDPLQPIVFGASGDPADDPKMKTDLEKLLPEIRTRLTST